MRRTISQLLVPFVLLAATHCGSDDDGKAPSNQHTSPEQAGEACRAASECYPALERDDLQGEVLCLDEVRGGYCTHTCRDDADCCAAEGECKTDIAQVCSPFQSTGEQMCFLSCESEDVTEGRDEQEYCQLEAGRDFICRSSGGGSSNRKVCVPGDCGVGAACGVDGDCATGLECALGFAGGYCTKSGCAGDADCPNDTRCVEGDDGENRCLRACAAESDCTFCRDSSAVDCVDDVSSVDGSVESLCVPLAR